MGQTSANPEGLRRAKRVVIYGAIVMVAMAALLVYSSEFSGAVLLAAAFGAVVVLTGYIWVALELAPARAMLFGVGSVVAAFPALLLLVLMVYVLSERFSYSFDLHGSAILWDVLLGVFIGSGIVAFLVGLVRYWHMSPAKPP